MQNKTSPKGRYHLNFALVVGTGWDFHKLFSFVLFDVRFYRGFSFFKGL